MKKKHLADLKMNQLIYHFSRLKNKQEREDIWIMIEDIKDVRIKSKLRHAFYVAIK